MNALENFGLLLVDDHPLFRDGLSMALQARVPGLLVRSVGCAKAARLLLAQEVQLFDLVLLDYRLTGADGLRCAVELAGQYPNVSFGLMSGVDDAQLSARVRDAGLVAYLPKALEIDALLTALCALASGETVFFMHNERSVQKDKVPLIFGLTARQLAVLELLATGATNKVIARQLGISPATVKNHVDSIFEKMGAGNRVQAVVMAQAVISELA